MNGPPPIPTSFAIAGPGLESLRKGDLITIRRGDGEPYSARIAGIDHPYPGATTFTLTDAREPVLACPYPDLIPPTDQDSTDARPSADTGSEVSAHTVRPPLSPAAPGPVGVDDAD